MPRLRFDTAAGEHVEALMGPQGRIVGVLPGGVGYSAPVVCTAYSEREASLRIDPERGLSSLPFLRRYR